MVGGGGEVSASSPASSSAALRRGRVDDGRAARRVREELDGELGAARLGKLEDFDVEVVAAEAVDEQGRRSSESWVTMSRWTVGVAVAVRAMMGAGRSCGR